MSREVTRRRALRRAALTAGLLAGATGGSHASQTERERFVPSEHGYGFRNWGDADRYFEKPSFPSRRSIRERIRSGWRDRLRADLSVDPARFPARLIEAMATQLRAAVVQRAGTNGHCYGMVLTAQRYFERPAAIPVDERVASEIQTPIAPVDEPSAPVYDEIVRRQADQYLRPRSWLGRRAVLTPERIDTVRLLRDVRAVVEQVGTATLTVMDGSLFTHQVLAYSVEPDGDGVRVPVYDPNRPAAVYGQRRPALRFEPDGDGLSMRPYGQYTHALFNQYDQIGRATDRDTATPMDYRRAGETTARESLFPLALVAVDTDDVSLVVTGPDEHEIGRVRATHMDRESGSHDRIRSLYGAPAGTYRIGVFGDAGTTYELRTTVVGLDGTAVDTSETATVEAGQRHEYELTVTDDHDGTVGRAGDGRSWPLVAGGVAGGLAVGALTQRALRRRNSDGGE